MAIARSPGNRQREQNPAYGLLRPFFTLQGVWLTDSDLWQRGVAAVSGEYALLSPSARARVSALAVRIKAAKEELQELTVVAGGAATCAACRGACCASGKYHFTVIDLLVFLADGRELFTPSFAPGRCPYLGAKGCLMTPEYRPLTCVIFNCEAVEEGMGPQESSRFLEREGELRALYGELEELFANRLTGGLLQNAERDVVQGGRGVLRRHR